MAAANDPKRARIAEGMSDGEADFMLSQGANADGLDQTAIEDAARAQPQPQSPAAPSPPQAQHHTESGAESDDGPEPPAGRDVPYQAFKRWKDRAKQAQADLHSTREQRAAEASELSTLRERFARLDERFNVFNQAITAEQEAVARQQQQRDAPQVPDPESDPIGFIKYLGAVVSGLANRTDQVADTVRESNSATATGRAYENDALTFARRQADFGQAYNWLMGVRDAQLAAAGYTDPAERARLILADERDIVTKALEARTRNPNAPGPAQTIYNIAKASGFQMPAVAQNGASTQNGAATTGNGAARPASTQAAPSVTAQVESIQRGQAASRSLSSGGGAPAPDAIDLAKIADMSDAEYLAFRQSMTPTQYREFQSLIGVR